MGHSRRVGIALVVIVACCVAPAHAQDATWLANPSSGNFNTGANWSSGSVPAGTATFGASTTTAITSSFNAIGGLTFAVGAPAYTFTGSFWLTGSGIINGSANAPSFVVQGFGSAMELFNSATLG